MASVPITSRQIDGETVETVADCIFWAPKSLQMVNAAMKRYLFLGRKVMTHLDSILKSRDCPAPSDSEGEGEGEGGMIWENGIVTCILSCKNRLASLCPTHDTACLGLVHSDDPERCYGEGGGRGVHVWERM